MMGPSTKKWKTFQNQMRQCHLNKALRDKGDHFMTPICSRNQQSLLEALFASLLGSNLPLSIYDSQYDIAFTEPLSSTIALFSNSKQMLHRNFHEWQVCWQTKKNEHLQQCVYFPLEIFLTLKHLIYWHFVVVQQIISPKRTLWGDFDHSKDCHQIILRIAKFTAFSRIAIK